jgi:lipoyl(octanoyl) transferase
MAQTQTVDRTTSSLVIQRVGFAPTYVNYEEAWQLQRLVHPRVVEGSAPDTVLLLEHEPVYTAGKRTDPSERPVDGTPVVDVDRGGKITWHGPGQLVGYPIVRLAAPIDVVAYVRRLEELMIGLAAHFGVRAERVEGRSGAWVRGADGEADRKLGAIGIRVSRQVTMHGFSFNCDNDLGVYDRVIACGLPDAAATSLTAELGRSVTVSDVVPLLEHRLQTIDLGGWSDLAGSLRASS